MRFTVSGEVRLKFSNLTVEADTEEEAMRNIENGELAMNFDTTKTYTPREDVEVIEATIEMMERVDEDDERIL